MSVSLVLALVSQLVLVYVFVSVSAVRECSPWWYVSVSMSGGFYFRRYQLVASDRSWFLGSGKKAGQLFLERREEQLREHLKAEGQFHMHSFVNRWC